MGSFKIPNVVERNGGYYFQAKRHMRRAGIHSEALGTDLAAAVKRAQELNLAWQDIRTGKDQPRQVKAPTGTLARLVDDLLDSVEFTDKSRARQAEIEYSLKHISPVFGPSRLEAITPANCEKFYDILREQGSVHKAARVIKDLRYLFNRAIRLRLITFNPALAFQVKQPESRSQTWTSDQVNLAVTTAWSEGFKGAAVALAIAYDTGLSPVDIRTLTMGQIEGNRIVGVTRAKTGRPVEPKLWPETVDWIGLYHNDLGVASTPAALVVRTRRGRPYMKDRLSRDIRIVLRKAGIPDAVQLRDLRRTATTESAENEATVPEIAAARGWAMATAAKDMDTYVVRSHGLADGAHDKRPRNMQGPKV